MSWYWWIPVVLAVWLLVAVVVGVLVGRALALGGLEPERPTSRITLELIRS